MSTKVSKSGWRQRILRKAATTMQQQGSRADHQAEGWQYRARAKENGHGWEGPRGLAGWRREQDLMCRCPRMAKKEEKM